MVTLFRCMLSNCFLYMYPIPHAFNGVSLRPLSYPFCSENLEDFSVTAQH